MCIRDRPTRGSLVEQYNDGKNGMIWIDALGVEFLGYIQRICAKIGLKMDVQIGRAVLPTLTSKNKSFYDEWKGPKQQTKRLDDIKHKGEDRFNYESDGDGKLPLHIVAELKVIKDALYRAKSLLLQEEVRKVIIASDHGASRLAAVSYTHLDVYKRQASARLRYSALSEMRWKQCSEAFPQNTMTSLMQTLHTIWRR